MGISFKIILLLIISLLSWQSNSAEDTAKWPYAYGMSTSELEFFLTTAKVTFIEETELGITKPQRITLEKNNIRTRAAFKTYTTKINISGTRSITRQINSADRFEYDKTAYKLDQLLRLNMIPVTVIRKIKNKRGAVVFWIENALVKKYVHQNKSNALEVCSYKKQQSIMHVFDILIHNDDRNMGNILFTINDCRLWMIDHSRAFRIKFTIPASMAKIKIRLSEELATRLAQLNYQILKEHLGEFINNNQINALLKRRDLILQKWENTGKLNYLEG